MNRGRAELALAGVTVIWGTSFVVVKAALTDISPLLFIALRFSLAAIALAVIYRRIFQSRARKQTVNAGLIAGSLLFTAFACQTIGLGLTTPSKSAFLTSLSVPMVPLASSIVYQNRPRLLEVIGIAIASFGMILMTFPGASPQSARIDTGDVLSFLCAVLFALHIVVIGHFAPVVGFESLAVIQVSVVALLGWCLLGLTGPLRFHFSPGVAAAVLATGLLATALAFTTMAWAQQYTTASRTALIFSLEPVIAWLTSWLLLGERMANRGKVGAGLILAGILVVEYKGRTVKRAIHTRHHNRVKTEE